MQTTKQYVRDQLKFAKQGADNLARKHGYAWATWLHGPRGECTATFEREGKRWSLPFYWTAAEDLGVLATRIEEMDFCMRAAMTNFEALKLGAHMRMTGGEAVN